MHEPRSDFERFHLGGVNMTESGAVLVVGAGPGLGLGSAVARRFSKAGLAIAVSTRTQKTADDLAAQINQTGGTSKGYVADATDEDAVIPYSIKWNAI